MFKLISFSIFIILIIICIFILISKVNNIESFNDDNKSTWSDVVKCMSNNPRALRLKNYDKKIKNIEPVL